MFYFYRFLILSATLIVPFLSSLSLSSKYQELPISPTERRPEKLAGKVTEKSLELGFEEWWGGEE